MSFGHTHHWIYCKQLKLTRMCGYHLTEKYFLLYHSEFAIFVKKVLLAKHDCPKGILVFHLFCIDR